VTWEASNHVGVGFTWTGTGTSTTAKAKQADLLLGYQGPSSMRLAPDLDSRLDLRVPFSGGSSYLLRARAIGGRRGCMPTTRHAS